jgi:hypothetical protein
MGVALGLMVLGAVFLLLKLIWRKLVGKITQVKMNVKMDSLEEEKLYEFVMDELENGMVRKGVWGKAVAKSNGNDSQIKSNYLDLRVKSLKNDANLIRSILKSEETTPDLIEVKKTEVKKSEVKKTEVKKSEVKKSEVRKETYMTNFFFFSFFIYSLSFIIFAVAYSWDSRFVWFFALVLVAWLSKISATAVRGEPLHLFSPLIFFVVLGISLPIILFYELFYSWQIWLCALLLSYLCATFQDSD